eukprot:750674-Hanusia_phi.AAC.2
MERRTLVGDTAVLAAETHVCLVRYEGEWLRDRRHGEGLEQVRGGGRTHKWKKNVAAVDIS